MGLVGGGWLIGCGAETPPDATPAPPPTSPTGVAARVLLAYFSRAGENYHYGGRTYLEVGNTVTYAVSGLGRAAEVYAWACSGATVGEGLAVRGEEVRQADAAVSAWLRRVGLLEEQSSSNSSAPAEGR
ncbi:hypothetical protein K1T35_18195 [Pseudonocardia sp. DSM 110487]|nr:hypothetical protein K1T35_18195 [Pseudonocardia sp. DSM 110487]